LPRYRAAIIGKFRDLHNTPARADYAVVRFETGYCQIWWDGGATPWGVNWTKIAMTPDWPSAYSALYAAIAARACN
jgi:hypothetical protein